MKNVFIIICLTLLTVFSHHQSNAQTTSSQFLDAKIKWTASGAVNHGVLKLYLTDLQNIQTIAVKIGSVSDSTDLYNQQFNINSLPVGSSISGNTVSIDIGNFSNHPDYFVSAKIILTNNDESEIQIHSSN